MCGILGIFDRAVGRGQNDGQDRLDAALRMLKHRGPDDHGLETFPVADGRLALGQTRLSIIDLSAGGHQPMHSHDGRHVIVFNGEIYNYADLRRELVALGQSFHSDSDTEVLLAAWATWGQACLPRLVGMFAFAVYDRAQATLTCVRDAFGIKPFFYSITPDGFQFASEAPALLALRGGKPGLNWQRAYDYLVHGDYDNQAGTFFEGVSHLLPGHVMQVSLGSRESPVPQPWWRPGIEEQLEVSYDDAVEMVRENFLQSVRHHLRSDVPLGAALSGGVDSSAVVCAMRHVDPGLEIHTFSYVAQGSAENEESWADMVNAHVGARAHKVVTTAGELARDLDGMIRAQGEPFGSTSIYAQYRVYQLARENGITVTLDGQGADESLGGYHGYPGPRMRSLLESQGPAAAWRYLNAWAQWPGRRKSDGVKMLAGELADGWTYQALRRLGGREMSPAWLRASVLDDAGVVSRHPRQRPEATMKGRRLMAELALALTRRGLTGLLRHGDRNSMRFSVESRVPFLTIGQVELLLSLPEHFLVAPNGETKSIFRAAMRGIVPDAILDRKDKIGFQTPEKAWLFSMSDTVRQWLSADIGVPFLDQAALVREFDKVLEGRRPFSWQVWRWVNFVRWYQTFLA